jgi:hypothetical protein
VILARVATEAFGVTVSVAFFVAVRATVATFDVRPTWAAPLVAPANRSAVVAVRTCLKQACMLDSGV